MSLMTSLALSLKASFEADLDIIFCELTNIKLNQNHGECWTIPAMPYEHNIPMQLLFTDLKRNLHTVARFRIYRKGSFI